MLIIRFYIKIIVIFIVLIFCNLFVFSQDDINLKSKKLLEIRKIIKEKEKEKKSLINKELCFVNELKKENNNINLTKKRLKKNLLDIQSTENNLKKTEKDRIASLSKEKNLYNEIKRDFIFFNKIMLFVDYEQDPLEYKIIYKILKYKKSIFEKNEEQIKIYNINLKKMSVLKNNLISLRKYENDLIIKYNDSVLKKEKILKIIVDKKRDTEKKIESLNKNAKNLQLLINKIYYDNKQNLSKYKNVRIIDKKIQELQWPVNGEIIANFGRSKHKTLNYYTKNNGIKILVNKVSNVRAVDAGVIVYADKFRSFNKIIIIDHRNSVFSIYGLLDNIFVKENQKVLKGEIIANIGNHENKILYFEIRYNNVPEDPILWLYKKV
jgi:murein DD-endopeptidase MepM/ murein hydrolase activator NlpD